VKTLSDIHRVPFKSYLSRQFSIAFDLYLSILNRADRLVQVSLERDDADYRIKHLCPPCTYILEGEEKLKFSMLYTVDGNDSLKRILRREEAPDPTVRAHAAPATTEEGLQPLPLVQTSATTEGGVQPLPLLGPSSEVQDSRTAGRGVYLTREQVDEWAKEVLTEEVPGFDDNPCAERWRNMKTELTSKMWGVFEETGLFLALCRHGFVLLLEDMVHSGEL
jgi:hypothetical protein